MKKYLPLLLLSVSMTIAACAQTKKTTAVAVAPQEQRVPTTTGYDWVQISRGACYGRCAIYTVKVMPDGLVQYTGKRFVTYEGIYEKKFAPSEVADIFNNFKLYRVDSTQDNYNVSIADLPTLTFEYSYKGIRRTINNAQFGPGLFFVLAQQIDQLAQVDDTWKKTGDANPE